MGACVGENVNTIADEGEKIKIIKLNKAYIFDSILKYSDMSMTFKQSTKIPLLINEAKKRLKAGNDPLHDEGHAERVATYAIRIAAQMGIQDTRYMDALIMSAWWHDVSRTITKKPSFVLMPFIDDTLSAVMLAITIVKRRAWNRSSLLALRLVLSKSIATGRIFSRFFLSKKMRTLLDILHDADTVDTLAPERTHVIHALVGSSKNYERAYQLMTWWFASTTFLHVKTQAAKEYLLDVLKDFVLWLKEEHIHLWHIERYGSEWVERMMYRLRQIMHDLEHQILKPSQI